MKFAQILAEHKTDIEDYTKFLYGIARNVFLQFLKNKYDDTASSLDENMHSEHSRNRDLEPAEMFMNEVGKYVQQIDEKETLEEKALVYIEQLPQAQRRVMKMRFIDKMTLQEICKTLGRDMNYVKTTQRRGLRGLEKLYTDNN